MGKAVKRGTPRAVIECFEEIPCNPCETCCPHHAITLHGEIWHIPELIPERCVGCGICVAHCSGQAIFVVDDGYPDGMGRVSMPFEFLPLPQKGEVIRAADRNGAYVCPGTVTKVMTSAAFDHTAVVTIEIPAEYVDTVRSIIRE